MDEMIFLDTYNIKTFPENIINYLKNYNVENRINNLRGFYTALLNSISFDIKESYLNRILKYLSSKEESNILLLDDISNGIYKKELSIFFDNLHLMISKTPNFKCFYSKLIEKCSFIYFNNEELEKINKAYNDSKYSELLYLLFLHAASNYKTNTPKIVSERLLNEFFCLFSTTKLRNALIKASADLGNETACAIYGTMLHPDFKKRLDYYLKGKNSPLSLWGVAFVIEQFKLSKERLQEINVELKNILIEGSKYINDVVANDEDPFHQECLMTSLKIYYYLANEKNFSKAYCSVGKFFLEEKVSIVKNNKIDKQISFKIGLDYSFRAIKLGNINAMQNVGKYYYVNEPNTDVKYKELVQIAANAQEAESNEYMAKILIDENKIDKVEKYLKFLSEENNGEALYRLGKIYESKMEIDDAIKYYEDAIKNNYYAASIELAKIYFEKYMKEDANLNTTGYILLAINILEKNYNEYSAVEKKEADFLLKNYKSILYK